MSEKHIPYSRQWVTDEDVTAVTQALRADFLTTGPLVAQFESALAQVAGSRRAVAVNSGTAALHAAYHAAGLRPGDEIVTTPLTFAATANAALYLGASVRFVDIEPDVGNIDPDALAEAIGDRTRLIVPVDYAGHPADYDRITDVARAHGVLVVSDAAHSLGACYRNRTVGCLADLTATSFHPVKAITTGEGGAVFCDDDEIADRIVRFRSHGIVRASATDIGGGDPWLGEMHELGVNYRLPDILCALGLSQLGRLSGHLTRRRAIAARYHDAFADLAEITLPHERQEVQSGWHLYVLRMNDAARRRPFFERLRELGLGVQVHYPPVYRHPYYRERGYVKGACPRAEEFYARCVSIPIYPLMSSTDVAETIDRVRRAAADVL